jgi:hypothetical protein
MIGIGIAGTQAPQLARVQIKFGGAPVNAAAPIGGVVALGLEVTKAVAGKQGDVLENQVGAVRANDRMGGTAVGRGLAVGHQNVAERLNIFSRVQFIRERLGDALTTTTEFYERLAAVIRGGFSRWVLPSTIPMRSSRFQGSRRGSGTRSSFLSWAIAVIRP